MLQVSAVVVVVVVVAMLMALVTSIWHGHRDGHLRSERPHLLFFFLIGNELTKITVDCPTASTARVASVKRLMWSESESTTLIVAIALQAFGLFLLAVLEWLIDGERELDPPPFNAAADKQRVRGA